MILLALRSLVFAFMDYTSIKVKPFPKSKNYIYKNIEDISELSNSKIAFKNWEFHPQ